MDGLSSISYQDCAYILNLLDTTSIRHEDSPKAVDIKNELDTWPLIVLLAIARSFAQ